MNSVRPEVKGRISEADIALLREEFDSNGRQSAAQLVGEADELVKLARAKRRVARPVKQSPVLWRLIEAEVANKRSCQRERSPGRTSETPENLRFVDSVRLGLTTAERKALLYFAKRNCKADSKNVTTMASAIIKLALAHPKLVSDWLDYMVRYCRAEGVDQVAFMVDSVAAQPEYRRVRVTA